MQVQLLTTTHKDNNKAPYFWSLMILQIMKLSSTKILVKFGVTVVCLI